MNKTKKELEAIFKEEPRFKKEIDKFAAEAKNRLFDCCSAYLSVTKDLYELAKIVHMWNDAEKQAIKSRITLKNDTIVNFLLDTIDFVEQILKKGTHVGRPPKIKQITKGK